MRRAAAAVVGALLLFALAAWWLTTSAPEAAHIGDASDASSKLLRQTPADTSRPTLPEGAAVRPEPLPAASPATAKPPPASATLVAGHVTRLAGDTPLRGATVELLGRAGAEGLEAVLACAVTRDDGAFRLDGGAVRPVALAVTWIAQREVLADGGAYDVRVPRDPVTARHELPPSGPLPTDLRLELDTGWTLMGVVHDTHGVSIPAAFVFAGKDGPEVHTGLDGVFELQDIERVPSDTVITVWAPFRERLSMPFPSPAEGDWLVNREVTLRHAGTVWGFVVDPDGHSLPGAIVMARVPGAADTGAALAASAPGAMEDSARARLASTTAGEMGAYVLEDLPEGRYDLFCTWMSHTPGTLASQDVRRTARVRGVDVRAEAPASASFSPSGAARLSGRALDSMGNPLHASHVAEYWTLSSIDATGVGLLVQARTSLEKDGSFVLDGLDPGPGELRILVQHGFRRRGEPLAPQAWQRQLYASGPSPDDDWVCAVAARVDLPDAGLSGLELRCSRAQGSLTGQVLSAAGRPLQDARLLAVSAGQISDSLLLSPAGRFELSLDDTVGRQDLCISAGLHLPAFISLPTASGLSDLGPIVLQRAPALSLLVVDDETGEPLPAAGAILAFYGGAQQDSVTRHAPLGDAAVALRADRTQGHRVLIVDAPGYREWRRQSAIDSADQPENLIVRLARR
jgi:hypothetical protein